MVKLGFRGVASVTKTAMTKITLQEAQVSLVDLIHHWSPGAEVIITENDLPVARLVATSATKPLRKLGTLSGTVQYMAPDFDAPLEVFVKVL